MRYDKLLNNTRFQSLVKRQNSVKEKYPRSLYVSSLSREIQAYIIKDLNRTRSSFEKRFHKN